MNRHFQNALVIASTGAICSGAIIALVIVTSGWAILALPTVLIGWIIADLNGWLK